MGVVVAAHHLVLEEKVAIKLLLPEAIGNADAMNRFVREARAAVRIRSEHVARVSDVGYLESGAPCIVMEHLQGVDLGGLAQDLPPLPVEQAIDFVLQACEAIADAHALGIVHRDLKPANLFWTQRSDGQACIKVLDFGISKLLTPQAPGDMTRTNAIIGSPYYMSPEQMQASRNVDVRTDVWSLGVIVFELLAKRPPFLGESISDLAINVATAAPLPLRSLRPDVPEGLERVIATSLEKARDRRYQTIGDFAVALGPFGSPAAMASVERIVGTLRQAGVPTNPPPALAMSGPTIRDTSTASSWGQTGQSSNRRATIAGITVAGAIALVGGALLAMRAMQPRPPVVTADTTPPVAPPAPAAPSVSVLQPLTMPASASVAAGTDASSSLSSHPVPSPPAPQPGRRGVVPPPAPAPAPTPAAPNAACNPPYYFDADGHKQYKPQCM